MCVISVCECVCMIVCVCVFVSVSEILIDFSVVGVDQSIPKWFGHLEGSQKNKQSW